MFVARVVVSGSRRESWTVVGEDGQLVEPAERFLSFLTDAGRSPNTVKAYAHDLRDWFAFLAGRALDWAAVSVEDVAAFVAWLRLPPSARGAGVAVLPLVGLVLGSGLGGSPVAWLVGTPAGLAVLAAGVLLEVAGLLWVRRLVRGVERHL